MKTKFPAKVMVFGMVSSERHIMPTHIYEWGYQSVPGCAESVVIPWYNQVPGGRLWVWQQGSAPAHKSKATQAWLQKKCYDFVPFSHCPLLPRLEPLATSFRREHYQHDLLQHQSQPDRRHPAVSRRGLRLKAATLNRCQLYYIIKLPELIFSIKVFKIKL